VVRVAIVVEQNWNAVPGGTARSTNRLIEALLGDSTVELVGVHGRSGTAPTLPLPVGLDTRPIPVLGRVLTQAWSRSSRPRIDRWVGPIDVVHGPGYLLPGSRCPAVVTLHDLGFLRNPEWFTPHGVRFFHRFLDDIVAGDQLVIVPSEATADDCLSAGIAAERITTIPWGNDRIVVSEEDRAAIRSRLGVREDAVLFVGTVEPRKNLAGLVAAMRLLPHRQLVVVGPSGWGDVDLGDATVLGSLSDHEVAALMSSAGVLAYPSHHEGFGLPVLEAMGQGTPVVVTAGTAPEWIAGDAGLAIDSSNPDALADAIERVLTDPALASRMGAMGLERAADRTWTETARRTRQVYAAAAG
jgi:glycosyltransferase involved in cell wall biosynthesis